MVMQSTNMQTIWKPTSDQTLERVLYLFAFCVVLFPLVKTHRGSPYLPILGSALMTFGIFHMDAYLNISAGDFWAHALPAYMAKTLGESLVLSSDYDGGPIVIATPIFPAIGAMGFAALFVGQWVRLGLASWMTQIHGVFYIFGTLFMASIAAGSVRVSRAARVSSLDAEEKERILPDDGGTAVPTSSITDRAVPHAAWRYVHDPAVVAAWGLILIAHRHDGDDHIIRNMHHTITGYVLLAISATLLLSFALHGGVVPAGPDAARALRLAQGYLWMLLGYWVLLMSFLFYIFKSRVGLHDMGYVPRTAKGHEWEEALSYFAVVGYGTACMLACTLSCSGANTLSYCCRDSNASRQLTRARVAPVTDEASDEAQGKLLLPSELPSAPPSPPPSAPPSPPLSASPSPPHSAPDAGLAPLYISSTSLHAPPLSTLGSESCSECAASRSARSGALLDGPATSARKTSKNCSVVESR